MNSIYASNFFCPLHPDLYKIFMHTHIMSVCLDAWYIIAIFAEESIFHAL